MKKLRVKKKHLGKRITNGNEEIILTKELTQKELLYIKNMIGSDYVEEYTSRRRRVNEITKDLKED